jgi:uncharacterized membrane protein YciS (DUF1049 family)
MSGFEVYTVIAETAIVLLLIVEVIIGVISLRRMGKITTLEKKLKELDNNGEGRDRSSTVVANIPYFASSKLRV